MKRPGIHHAQDLVHPPSAVNKTVPRRGKTSRLRSWRQRSLLTSLLTLLLVTILTCAYLVPRQAAIVDSAAPQSQTPQPSATQSITTPTTEPATEPAAHARQLGNVRSVGELRAFCHARVPQLEHASWSVRNISNVSVATPMGQFMYFLEDVPVCIGDDGDVYVDHIRFDTHGSVLHRNGSYPIYPLTDKTFKLGEEQGFATAVPALAILAKGKWIDSHIWHLIRDCIGALMAFFTRYHYGEMFTLPTQTLLLRGEKGSWIDRYGDTKLKMALSAQVLNSFSSPRLGGPFFNTSPMVVIRARRQLDAQAAQARVKRPLLQCYCQAMAVGTRRLRRNVDPHIYYGIQDLVTRQFGEDDYRTGYSLEETDRRRRASHPWATTFWNESTFDANGTYRPRALVIHRKSRLIGNYEKYIAHLHTLGFRVEEIFPERLPLEQQYHLGRYADLLVGMHGLGIAHGFWMDRFPIGCRSIVEFRPWVTPGLPIDLHRILGRFMGFDYHYPEPINVTFADNIKNKERARTRLMDPANVHRAWSYREFTDQTAFYNETNVLLTLSKVREHLDWCLPLAESVPRFSPVLGGQS